MKQKGIIGIVCLLFTMLLLSMQTVQAVSQDRNTEKLLHDSNVEVVSQAEGYQTTKLDIPDPEFRKWIWNNVLNQREDIHGGVEATNYEIYESDLEAIYEVDSLKIFDLDIFDLTGINYFANVTVLNLIFAKSEILSLELDKLEKLEIHSGKIRELSIKTPNVTRLLLSASNISSMTLDLPKVELISILQSNFDEITINSPSCTSLEFMYNRLRTVDFNIPNLERVGILGNKITQIALKADHLEELNLFLNSLTSVELDLPKLKKLDISKNNLSSLGGNLPSIEILDVSTNNFGSIDLSQYSNLTNFNGYAQTIELEVVKHAEDNLYYVDFKQINNISTDRVNNVLHAESYDTVNGIATFIELPTFINYSYDVDNSLLDDLEVNASYSVDYGHRVTFVDGFNGNTIRSELVYTGQNANAPIAPEVDGYRFIGWDYDFSEVVTDMVVTALYEKVVLPAPTYKIDFNTMGGILLPQQEYELGSVIQLDMVPIREGYQFVGWYLDEQYEMSVSEIVVSEDLTIYAKWEKIEAPLPPVVDPDEEDKPLPPVVEPEEEEEQFPPGVEAPEEDGSTTPGVQPESPQVEENPTEKPPGTGTRSQLAWMMLLLVVSLFGFFLVKQNRV